MIDLLSRIAKEGEVFTLESASKISGLESSYLKKLFHKFEKDGYIKRISKGKYLIVPLSADRSNYTLHEFIIGAMLVSPYSVAYWSALNYYGMTEQIPGTVFLQTTSWKEHNLVEVFGVKYKFVRIKEAKFFGIKKVWIDNVQINITDKEKTIIDCLDKPQHCGGIIEVAKALENGRKELDFKKLSEYANQIGNSGVTRRLGYLCNLFKVRIKLTPPDVRNYLLLDPTMPPEGTKNAKWRLIINIDEKAIGEL
ncbi:MAG: type IV toxin-antitoxin system AbiEi family antitoxin domain-containing protein [Caldisericaceae bacterium]